MTTTSTTVPAGDLLNPAPERLLALEAHWRECCDRAGIRPLPIQMRAEPDRARIRCGPGGRPEQLAIDPLLAGQDDRVVRWVLARMAAEAGHHRWRTPRWWLASGLLAVGATGFFLLQPVPVTSALRWVIAAVFAAAAAFAFHRARQDFLAVDRGADRIAGHCLGPVTAAWLAAGRPVRARVWHPWRTRPTVTARRWHTDRASAAPLARWRLALRQDTDGWMLWAGGKKAAATRHEHDAVGAQRWADDLLSAHPRTGRWTPFGSSRRGGAYGAWWVADPLPPPSTGGADAMGGGDR